MRAVLLSQGYHEALEPIVSGKPSPLFCLADKPIIVHIIESLARQGITQFDIVLHHLPEMVEEALGTGRRWGVTITYHLAQDPKFPLSTIAPAMKQWSSPQILLGQGDRFPIVEPQLFYAPTKRPRLFFDTNEKWTGWGVIPEKVARQFTSSTNEEQLFSLVSKRAKKIQTPSVFSTCTFQQLHRDNRRLILQQLPEGLLPTGAKMVEPNLWLSKGVVLHPKAIIRPPVFIGEKCQINHGASVGPYAVVENGCLIDVNSSVSESVICQGSYIGEALDIKQSIVDGNHVVNLSLQTQVTIPDDHILSDLRTPSLRRLPAQMAERALALTLLVLLSPLAIGRKIIKEEVVALPSTKRYKTFHWLSFETKRRQSRSNRLISCIPSLIHIIGGKAHFVGITPRKKAEMQEIPPHWQDILLKGRLGLFTLLNGTESDEASFVAEAYYVTQRSLWGDIKILFEKLTRWLIHG